MYDFSTSATRFTKYLLFIFQIYAAIMPYYNSSNHGSSMYTKGNSFSNLYFFFI